MIKTHFIFLILMLGGAIAIEAQGVSVDAEPYGTYTMAMNLAHEGRHQAARELLQPVVDQYPQNADLASLLAKTYSWDGNFDEARKHLNRITSRDRGHKDSWVAAINNERFARNLSIALGMANKALTYLQDDQELRQLRESIMTDLEKSYNTPEKEPAKEIEEKEYRNRLGLINALDIFDVVYDPMFHAGIEYIRESRLGQIIPRINYSNRFQLNGLQYELDLYPKFSKRYYGYLNYGYSDAAIFPKHRIGGELYAAIPGGFETSLGLRYLQFSTGEATLYTASLGWYTGNYYFSIRPFIQPNSEDGTALSGIVQARKYFRDRDNYVSVHLGFGYSPELKQLLSNGTLLAETLLYIESQQLMLEYQFTPGEAPFIYKALLGLTRQELVGNPGNYFWALTTGLRYHLKF